MRSVGLLQKASAFALITLYFPHLDLLMWSTTAVVIGIVSTLKGMIFLFAIFTATESTSCFLRGTYETDSKSFCTKVFSFSIFKVVSQGNKLPPTRCSSTMSHKI